MIRIKPGVTFLHNSFMMPPFSRMIWVAQMEAPTGYEMTITSGSDGKHKENSAHYKGKGIDLRVRDLPGGRAAETWARRIQSALGSNYFVLLEKTHIHIQCNINL